MSASRRLSCTVLEGLTRSMGCSAVQDEAARRMLEGLSGPTSDEMFLFEIMQLMWRADSGSLDLSEPYWTRPR